MPILIADLVDDHAVLRITCVKCRKVVERKGLKLLQPLGMQEHVRVVQQRLRCNRCNTLAEVIILLPWTALDHERLRHELPLHE